MQALTYEQPLRAGLGRQSDVPAYLYCRSWANWAELSVWAGDACIVWRGEINAKCKSGEFEMQYTLTQIPTHKEALCVYAPYVAA